MLIQKAMPALGAAVAIAAGVTFYLSPKLKAAQERQEPAPVVATAVVEDTKPLGRSNAAFIDRKPDGHYWTTADVDGTAVKFMVDTGASIVALTMRDAQRVGINMEELEFDAEISTAGGKVFGAYVVVSSIRIGRVEMENVDAIVLPEGLENSLLGMTFLGELYSYEFRKNQLIIRQ